MTGMGKTTTTVAMTGNGMVDALIEGIAWSGKVTYAFPGIVSCYGYSTESSQNFGSVSTAQRTAAKFVLDQSFGSSANDGFSVEGFTNLKVASGSITSATIRFAQSDAAAPTAYSYYPGNHEQSGDVWFSTNFAGTAYDFRNAIAGNYAWHTMIHEIGHALGLKHGDDDPFLLPANVNSLEYSVMTTTSFIGDTVDGYDYEEFGGPQTFMMADIAALQHLYGADYTTNAGNTIYKWLPGSGITYVDGQAAIEPGANRIFATIWDGGGVDTFDLKAYDTDLCVDLRPGRYSMFSDEQLAYLGGGPNEGFARGNIFNAMLFEGNLCSIVENAWGGSGDDYLRGNQVSNVLRGYDGDDVLNGARGKDYLIGGAGSDVFVFKADYGRDIVRDFSDGEDRIQLASFGFETEAEALSFAHADGGDTIFAFGGSDILILRNFDISHLDAGDVII